MDTIFEQWRGVVLPKGTPPAIVQKLQDIIKKCVEDPRYGQRLEGMMAQPLYKDSKTFGQLIESENTRIENTIRSAKIGDRYK